MLYNNPIIGAVNPFMYIDIEAEIQGFLEWIRPQVSEAHFRKSVKVYAPYLSLLASPPMLAQAINAKTPRIRTHVMATVANFSRYLDMKYSTTVFTDYYEALKKRLRIKWNVELQEPRRIPSLDELIEIIGIAARVM